MKITFFKNGQRRPYVIIDPPAATIVAYAGASAPAGWLLCDGTAYSQSTYDKLYTALGGASSPYGVSGSNFSVPDFRQKAPMGAGTGTGGGQSGTGAITGGSSLTARTVGSNVGSQSVTLTGAQSGYPSHGHSVTEYNHGHTLTVTTATHRHTIPQGVSPFGKSGGTGTLWLYPERMGNAATYYYWSNYTTPGHALYYNSVAPTVSSPAAANGVPHANAQPSLVVNYIIKT